MLGPDTPCMVGAFDGAWSLLKALQPAYQDDPAALEQNMRHFQNMQALNEMYSPMTNVYQQMALANQFPQPSSLQSMPVTPAPTITPDELAEAIMQLNMNRGTQRFLGPKPLHTEPMPRMKSTKMPEEPLGYGPGLPLDF